MATSASVPSSRSRRGSFMAFPRGLQSVPDGVSERLESHRERAATESLPYRSEAPASRRSRRLSYPPARKERKRDAGRLAGSRAAYPATLGLDVGRAVRRVGVWCREPLGHRRSGFRAVARMRAARTTRSGRRSGKSEASLCARCNLLQSPTGDEEYPLRRIVANVGRQSQSPQRTPGEIPVVGDHCAQSRDGCGRRTGLSGSDHSHADARAIHDALMPGRANLDHGNTAARLSSADGKIRGGSYTSAPA